MTDYQEFRGHYYEPADGYSGAYTVKRRGDVAWSVYGWEMEPNEDTEWSGYMDRTGNLVCVMIGDDRPWIFGPDELSHIEEDEYCSGCGQIGCGHGG